jgi:hypothetical protein
MASYNYTTVITQVDDSTLNFSVPSVTPPSSGEALDSSNVENMITSVLYNFVTFPSFPLPSDVDLTSTTAGMGAVFGDAVYEYNGVFFATGPDSYTSQEFFLVTTAIDAAIPLMPQTTGREIANYDAAVVIRQNIQDYFDAADYTNANIWIIYLTNLLAGTTSGGALEPVATLASSTTINTELADTTAVFPDAFGYYNVLTNTLTEVEYPYTWEFTPNSGVSQDHDTTQPSLYPDGVYSDYVSVLCTFDDSGDYPALLNEGTGYLLVTTTVDAQVTLYGANHNPNNTVQAAAYAQMLQLQDDIDTAFAAEDYDETNDLIAELQALLALGLSINLYAELTSASTMVIYFNSLPSGTYTNATGTLQNTLTLTDATFNGFPASNLDLSTTLDSSDYNFGTTYPDGVYQGTVNFYVNGLLFQGTVYLPVTTAWQCCISKAAGKKCGKLDTALQQANLNNAVRAINTFNNVNTANGLISEGNRECTRCGCGCG